MTDGCGPTDDRPSRRRSGPSFDVGECLVHDQPTPLGAALRALDREG